MTTTETTNDLYREAVSIIENDIALDDIVKFKHLEAAVEMVQQHEGVILTLRELLEQANCCVDRVAEDFNDDALVALHNRINNVLATTWP